MLINTGHFLIALFVVKETEKSDSLLAHVIVDSSLTNSSRLKDVSKVQKRYQAGKHALQTTKRKK